MYPESLERLIQSVIADGVITDKEREVVLKKARELRIDPDEIEVYMEGLLVNQSLKSTSSSSKLGTVKQCPNCGATVNGGEVKCTSCGYVFSGVEANSSAKLLDNRLRSTHSPAKMAAVISSFPIPSTRADVIDFLCALEPKAKGVGEVAKAYKEKFNECLNKAVILFPDDPAIERFHAKRKAATKRRIIIFTAIAVAIAVIIAIISVSISNSIAKAAEEKEKLRVEYAQWAAQADKEIAEYTEMLTAKLDALPTPTRSNYEKVAMELSKITWDKKWFIDWDKYSDVAPWIWEHEYSKAAREAFLSKKNRIGDLIRNVHNSVHDKNHQAENDQYYYYD